MKLLRKYGLPLCGICAGGINGLFGSGGGMVLVPLLNRFAKLEQRQIFPASVAVILPISLVTLGINLSQNNAPWETAAPYLIGSVSGGILAGFFGKKIPTAWLHRILGGLMLWGGVRYLC